MEREIIITGDGSSTIHLPDWNEQYHSKHGAIQEAYHVFIKHGLEYFFSSRQSTEISILEIGFGTGLNAFITLLEADSLQVSVNYCGVEGYPVSIEEINKLNYPKLIEQGGQTVFNTLHEVSWETSHKLTANFSLTKQQRFFSDIQEKDICDVIYFDAFGARVQPELWTETIFKSMYEALKPNGILVTYSAKGSVRRAMEAVGFIVERLPGPPGKREMLRATKLLG
ncbi:tRNA (5-methylaminomethyl-2-thiouridine)(34)-methyltransferase MnmD [Snuella sedimenti]|uniref:tRNA (5-methylaminomethyl-2-thiouridine)(34)-methyltransferase MnmD n=1 Tax=Snuella sedimenti TaxID=2798802 RepID=A0A8J7IMG0_9FLAO|nr:tRNA (5-methylaminomethyl-2-thiouridine)(34)-methyltransferase MnmD [Snuella sedimenti]MBJ6367197.1 tRNA (5-methylaminomethyl-2-thiouridine)(34)-methyltransferase MnmD [Snuella sedimenti]